MDPVSIASSNRLLEAFERMSVPQGEGLVSAGPSPVPDSLSRAFEQLLEKADAQPAHMDSTGRTELGRTDFSGQEEVQQSRPSTNAIDGDALVSSRNGETPLLTPSELYHLQFQVAMLRFQADSGYQVTQKTTQGLDSLLRNQS